MKMIPFNLISLRRGAITAGLVLCALCMLNGLLPVSAAMADEDTTTGDQAVEAAEQEVDLDEINSLPGRDHDKLPRAARDVEITQRAGEFLDLDVFFYDEQNNHVQLKKYFQNDRPVMLSFNYSNCPKLCSVQLENMVLALREVDFKVGKDFQVVSISIDPLEQSSRARQVKEKYTTLYNKAGTDHGFHFMTGGRDEIEYATELCGFGYKYIPEQKLYSHLPVFILLSPKGRIVRYIHGLEYDAKTIELALIESAEGKIGSPINRISYGLGCFLFDETTGKYTFQAMALMRLTGAVMTGVLLFTLVPYWFFRRGLKPADKDIDNKGAAATAAP